MSSDRLLHTGSYCGEYGDVRVSFYEKHLKFARRTQSVVEVDNALDFTKLAALEDSARLHKAEEIVAALAGADKDPDSPASGGYGMDEGPGYIEIEFSDLGITLLADGVVRVTTTGLMEPEAPFMEAGAQASAEATTVANAVATAPVASASDAPLIDVSEAADEAGWLMPVGVSPMLMNDLRSVPPHYSGVGDGLDRRLDTVLVWGAFCGALNGWDAPEPGILVGPGIPVGSVEDYAVRLVIESTDGGEPVATMLHPEED